MKNQSSKNKEHKAYWKEQEKLAKGFKLSAEDIHNLFDLVYFIDDMTHKTLRLNKMDKWFEKFMWRLDEVVMIDVRKRRKIYRRRIRR